MVEYSTYTGIYCATYDAKMTFYMPEFSSSNIISHHFHVDKNEGDLVIGYDMIIGRDMMV